MLCWLSTEVFMGIVIACDRKTMQHGNEWIWTPPKLLID